MPGNGGVMFFIKNTDFTDFSWCYKKKAVFHKIGCPSFDSDIKQYRLCAKLIF
jgi:hypothetical protein